VSSTESYDAIVVGGGPAGSVMAWSLARRGIRVAVVERARFPREKVCGDFVEPGGLRILEAMGCLQPLEAAEPLPITHVATFIQSKLIYRGKIPYYVEQHGLPSYGYIVPRSELDTELLNCARAASATVYEGCSAKKISHDGRFVQVSVSSDGQRFDLSAPLIVGADGVASIVARSFGQIRDDPRFTCIAQRSYVDGVSLLRGEATTWFDEDLFPGYGWLFPMSDGRANVGVGVLSEARRRHGMNVPELFRSFIEKLKRHHPACAHMQLEQKPRGGTTRSYSAIGRNVFDGGLLIGDAGSFVDPLTGEGITPGMESALIASDTVVEALERGRFDAGFLSRFEHDFRDYFESAMRYLQFTATMMRNRHMREFCLRTMKLGWQEAATDPYFARVAGASFGGLELRTSAVLGQLWAKVAAHMAKGTAGMMLNFLNGKNVFKGDFVDDIRAWQRGMQMSMLDDPLWHMGWLGDVAKSAARMHWTSRNVRVRGTAQITQGL